jgi:hypothetical protein
MNTIKYRRNTFFKKNVIETGLNITSNFTDLGNSTATTFKLSDQTAGENSFILSGSVPEQPSYGAGELQYGCLMLYPSEIETEYNRELPEIVGYGIDKNIDIKEGAYTFACSGNTSTNPQVGQHLGMYAVYPFSNEPQIVEDFEGSPDGLENVTRMGNNNVISMSDPYITEDTLKTILKREGYGQSDRRIKSIDLITLPHHSEGAWNPGSSYTTVPNVDMSGVPGSEVTEQISVDRGQTMYQGEKRYNIEFVSGTTRKFRFKNRGLLGSIASMLRFDNQARNFAARKHDIFQNEIGFATKVTAPSSVEGNPEADKGNTIFSDFYATRNFSNPFDSTTDDPMITSAIELSSEKALNGGQSLRIYHNWGFAGPTGGTKNEIIQNQIQVSGNLNPQCARVSLYDIPYPSLPFDVGAAKWQGERFQTVSNFGDPHAVVPELRIGMNVSKLEPNIPLNVNAGTSFTTIRLLADNSNDAASADYSSTENTFLRSVVVTFSNYKPKKEHTSLDKFLDYGLNNYYSSGSSDNIVGGIVFTRFGIDGATTAAANNMFAYPLPVMKIKQVDNGGSPSTSNFTLANGGMGKVSAGSLRLSDPDVLIWGSPAAPKNASVGNATADNQLPYVNLPMNSFFNMRCFFDIMQYNNQGSCVKRPYAASSSNNPTDTSSPPRRGVPMRVIFDTEGANALQTVYDNNAGAPVLVDGGSRVQSDTRNLPFLDVFFPAGDATFGTALREYNWYENPEYFPKHMTIWVQNYCWISGSTGAQPYRFGEQGLYPEGAAREAEVFIDNVQLFNFEPTVKNVNSGDILNFKPQTHLSPLQKRYDATGPKYGSGWVAGNPTTLTGSLTFTSGDATVEIGDNQAFDGTFLDNHGTVTLTSSKFAGSKTLQAVTGRLTFEMTTDTGITSGEDDAAVITCGGTQTPSANRANLRKYDTGMFLVMGWDKPEHLASTAPSTGGSGTGYTGYILGNDFSTFSWDENSDNAIYPDKLPAYITNVNGAIFSQQITGSTAGNGELPPDNFDNVLGGDLLVVGPSVEVQTGTAYTNNISGALFNVYSGTTAAVAGDQINLGISSGGGFASTNDYFSLDGFRQKGFMYVNVSGSGTAKPSAGNEYPRTRWGTRENVLVSTKVKNIADTKNSKTSGYEHYQTLNKNQLEVEDISVFNFDNPNERYVAYLMGAGGNIILAGDTIQKKRKGGLKLAEEPSGNIVTFTQDLFMSSMPGTPLFIEENINRLYIGPQKYWLSMIFDTDETTTERSFSSFCTINSVPSRSGDATSISGTTYSEAQYSYNASAITTGGASGLYTNEWNVIPQEGNSTLMTAIDYGYGAMDKDSGQGGYMVYGSIKPSSYNFYPLNALSNNYKVGDNIPLMLSLNSSNGQKRSATFFSDDYTTDTTKKPTMYWSFIDNPPVLRNFSVAPEVNVVEGNTDLYDLSTETLNAVRFNWEEENADDVWYRYVIVDNQPINDKYHSCTMRLPLNEGVTNFGAAPSLKVYNPVAGVDASAVVGSEVRQVLEGQGGYAPVLGGSTANSKITVTSAANFRALEDLDEFSLVIHWTPAASDAGNKRYIVTQMSTTAYPGPTADAFIAYKDTDDTIKITMGTGVALASVKSVVCDGETPTNIIMTYNSGSSNPNKANLYIDGSWQDGSTGQTRVQGDEDFIVGGYFAALQSGSAGMFEEILIYTKELHVIDRGDTYTMQTNNLDDFYDAVGNTSLNKENITHTARLFAADYHNFRGYNIREQAMSNQTSWRTTTI